MKLRIDPKEIAALLKLSSLKRYEYALKRIADTEEIWTIGENNSTILIQKEMGVCYFAVWPAAEYAEIFMSDNPSYHCVAVSLDEFEQEVAKMIMSKGYQLNVFPTSNKHIGHIVSLNQFENDLSHYLDDYK